MSPPPVSRTIEAVVRTIRVGSIGDGLPDIPCQHCAAALELHQPDQGDPHRLLGICDRCRAWHVIALEPGRSEAVLILLPNRDSLREIVS